VTPRALRYLLEDDLDTVEGRADRFKTANLGLGSSGTERRGSLDGVQMSARGAAQYSSGGSARAQVLSNCFYYCPDN